MSVLIYIQWIVKRLQFVTGVGMIALSSSSFPLCQFWWHHSTLRKVIIIRFTTWNFQTFRFVFSNNFEFFFRCSIILGRNRRDVEVNSDTFEQNIFNIQKLTEFVQEQSNKTFQREINQALTKLISNFPVKKLCKNVLVQCKNGLWFTLFEKGGREDWFKCFKESEE